MMIDVISFAHSYCLAAALRAATMTPAVPIYYLPTDNGGVRNLWRGKAIDKPQYCMDRFGILRAYGGPSSPTNPAVTQQFQIDVWGITDGVALGDDYPMELAQILFEAFTRGSDDQANQELRGLTIAGYKASDNSADGNWQIVGVETVDRPRPMVRDDKGRLKIVSIFNTEFYKLPA